MSSQIILILVIICLSALLSSHVLACQEILEHTSSSCNHSCLRINPESWRKCITIPIFKQPCANIIFDMSHAGIMDVTMLKGHASFVRESLLQACHQDKVFSFRRSCAFDLNKSPPSSSKHPYRECSKCESVFVRPCKRPRPSHHRVKEVHMVNPNSTRGLICGR